MTMIKRLAQWATTVSCQHSEAATLGAKHAIEDTIACMIGGSGDTAAANVRKAIAHYTGGVATIIGAATAHAPWAALANGTAAHALDYDDTFLPAVNHAGASLVSSLLALAEERNLSGNSVVDAYIVGLEIDFWLARGLMRSHYDIGWHSTSTIGTIGAAGACARLLGLDEQRTAHALSLGVSMAAGMKVQFGTMAKPLHAGLAAQHGVEAALLAESGVQGRMEALEGPMGFLDLCGGPAANGWLDVMDDIGKGLLAMEERGLMIKRFPCCASTHRVLDCVLELIEEEGVVAEDVEKVETFIGAGNARNLMYSNPTTELQARFSMQYCIAVALLYGNVTLKDFTPAAVERPEVRSLFSMTTVTPYESADEQKNTDLMVPHRVKITMKNGVVHDRSRDLPKGTVKYPMDDEDRRNKFIDCAQHVMPVSKIDEIRKTLANLDSEQSIRALTAQFTYTAGSDSGGRFASASDACEIVSCAV